MGMHTIFIDTVCKQYTDSEQGYNRQGSHSLICAI